MKYMPFVATSEFTNMATLEVARSLLSQHKYYKKFNLIEYNFT
jgi:hypothetical protein